MSRIFRIGVQIDAADPFWVLVRDAVHQCGLRQGVNIIPIDADLPHTLPERDHIVIIEELLAQEIDSIICLDWPPKLTQYALEQAIPVIHLTESDIRHPYFVSPVGLYDIARDLTLFIAKQLGGRGRILEVGGEMAGVGEDGRSRIAGIRDILHTYPEMTLKQIPCLWTYGSAHTEVLNGAWQPGEHFDALFGLSDSLALGARDAALQLGLIRSDAVITGLNGDPLALAAIMEGTMTATVQTSPVDIAEQVVNLACLGAEKQTLPTHYRFKSDFVSRGNVDEIAVKKLIAIADIPSQLIGDNRRQAQERLSQLETGIRINQQVGAILNYHDLARAITELIRESYQYDGVRFYLWDEAQRKLTLETTGEAPTEQIIPPNDVGLLAETLRVNQPIFIPDIRFSHRFPPDPLWPETRSRVIVPIRLGDKILGLLDLHSYTPRQHARQDLIGLQALADQFGIAMRNAELYSEAILARASAEKADQVKTRLLANVSHELRTPLNVILGYASTAMATPNPYQSDLPPELLRDLSNIYASGEHLMRVINDLLDLSRAEINELDLFIEPVHTRPFLEEVFRAMAEGLPPRESLSWRLDLPDHLPLIQADPVRLRQILFNLLNNAYKFTPGGEIILGAEVIPARLHLWVKDTGSGIPPAQQEGIFEPFSNSILPHRRTEGVGLGLSITRRLVLLHHGSMTLDSVPGQGSTFHIYLPLPTLSGQTVIIPKESSPVLVVISACDPVPEAIRDLSERRGWAIHRVCTQDVLPELIQSVRPAGLAWDIANASPDDWNLVETIRGYPQLANLPFILFGADQTPAAGTGLTHFLVKPLMHETLMDTIGGLRTSIKSGPILVVEDDPLERKLYKRLVNQVLPGYLTVTAETGKAALDFMAREIPSLVILHLGMPDIDGYTILNKMRTRPATQRVPVVLMSGRTLTYADVQRLDHMSVIFISKSILNEAETSGVFEQAVSGRNALPPQTSLVVKQVMVYLQQNYNRAITRHELADAVGVSQDYLSHIFHQELNLSPWDYLTRLRIKKAMELLFSTSSSIATIACQVGFEDVSYFNRVFRKQTGCTPSAYRENSIKTPTGKETPQNGSGAP